MRTLVASAIAVLVAGSGCGLVVDGAYLLGNGRSTSSSEQSSPIPQTIDRVEYEAVPRADGTTQLACVARTRQLQRTWWVTKTYRLQGSFDKNAYTGTTMLDVIFGAVTAGTLLAVCAKDDSDTSCWHMMWASPFALDIGYSLIRRARAKPPVLIDKSSTEGSVGLAAAPLSERTTDCESLASLWLGSAKGPSDLQVLRGYAEGAETRTLADGASEVTLDQARNIALTPEVAERWALNGSLELLAVDHQGVPHPVTTDRCALLRPVQTSLSASAQTAYRNDCTPSGATTAQSNTQ